MKRDYLSFADVIAIHQILVVRYGGDSGMRDPGALDAALFRPQSGYYEDLVQEAAALFESLVINHPFMDGNKRIGLAATDTFLRINGLRITESPDALYKWMMDALESQTFSFEEIERFLTEKTESIE